MGKWMQIWMFTLVLAFICSGSETTEIIEEEIPQENENFMDSNELAIVTKVSFSGDENNYSFNVTISSPDTGCDQYADWWEVLDLDGNLIYRRILAHSHVNEQPFTRSGGAIAIATDTEVYVRVHMNNSSYGTMAMKGSASNGFESVNLSPDFAKALENEAPLPSGCAF